MSIPTYYESINPTRSMDREIEHNYLLHMGITMDQNKHWVHNLNPLREEYYCDGSRKGQDNGISKDTSICLRYNKMDGLYSMSYCNVNTGERTGFKNCTFNTSRSYLEYKSNYLKRKNRQEWIEKLLDNQ